MEHPQSLCPPTTANADIQTALGATKALKMANTLDHVYLPHGLYYQIFTVYLLKPMSMATDKKKNYFFVIMTASR